MLRTIRRHLAARRARRHAQATYAELEARTRLLRDLLFIATDHRDRARLIGRYGRTIQTLARIHRTAWSSVPVDDASGRDAAGSIAATGTLLLLIADAERAIAYPRYGRRYTDSPLEPTIAPILDQAVTAGDITRAVLTELAGAVEPVVGWRAVATIRRLPVVGGRDDYRLTA